MLSNLKCNYYTIILCGNLVLEDSNAKGDCTPIDLQGQISKNWKERTVLWLLGSTVPHSLYYNKIEHSANSIYTKTDQLTPNNINFNNRWA